MNTCFVSLLFVLCAVSCTKAGQNDSLSEDAGHSNDLEWNYANIAYEPVVGEGEEGWWMSNGFEEELGLHGDPNFPISYDPLPDIMGDSAELARRPTRQATPYNIEEDQQSQSETQLGTNLIEASAEGTPGDHYLTYLNQQAGVGEAATSLVSVVDVPLVEHESVDDIRDTIRHHEKEPPGEKWPGNEDYTDGTPMAFQGPIKEAVLYGIHLEGGKKTRRRLYGRSNSVGFRIDPAIILFADGRKANRRGTHVPNAMMTADDGEVAKIVRDEETFRLKGQITKCGVVAAVDMENNRLLVRDVGKAPLVVVTFVRKGEQCHVEILSKHNELTEQPIEDSMVIATVQYGELEKLSQYSACPSDFASLSAFAEDLYQMFDETPIMAVAQL
jgi:hypothetical protein